jgi:Leucine-rich repeat (LRR) protein
MEPHHQNLVFALLLSLLAVVFSATDPNDVAILNLYKKNLKNLELLKWPENDANPCASKWPHVYCNGNDRLSQIQVQNMGLIGPLPQNLNQLSMLTDLGLQMNQFTGTLPSFSGLTNLKNAYLDYNGFDTIQGDFFDGLVSLEVLALDSINLNASTGWMFPTQLQNSPQLRSLSCRSCNLVGPLPSFMGKLASLSNLKLSGNNSTSEIPASFNDMILQIFQIWVSKSGLVKCLIKSLSVSLSCW